MFGALRFLVLFFSLKGNDGMGDREESGGASLIHCTDFENLVSFVCLSYFGVGGVCICSANGGSVLSPEGFGSSQSRKA